MSSIPDVLSKDEGWRTGRKVGRTLYYNGQLVGMMDTRELATKVVEALSWDYAGRIGQMKESLAVQAERDELKRSFELLQEAYVKRDNSYQALLEDIEELATQIVVDRNAPSLAYAGNDQQRMNDMDRSAEKIRTMIQKFGEP